MNAIRTKIENRIDALPGSTKTKKKIVDTIAFGIGAAIGAGLVAAVYYTGKSDGMNASK